jgi:CRISPR-associated protein Cas2
MLVVVSYDVSTTDEGGTRRLARVAKACKNFGQRVQYSVFECSLEPAQWVGLKNSLLKEINPETDSLRFYFLGANWRKRVEHIGAKKGYDPDDPLVV